MPVFTKEWQKIKWDDINFQIYSQTASDVENALMAKNLGLNEMLALLSPVAMPYIEPLAQRAQQLTRQRFGNTINFYVPLYLSNFCSNECTYCGFSMSNPVRRKMLDEKEIIRECQAIRMNGIDNILLVTGEHKKIGINYFRHYVPLVRQMFSTLMMEIQPLSQEEYIELKKLGLDGVLVYQETYHQPTYQRYHLRGEKQDFIWRLETPDRLAQAGIDKIGLGVLIGLSDNWRTDYYLVARHLAYMRYTYWKNRYSISFPRLLPSIGAFVPNTLINEAELLQLMCAFRLFAPEVEISLSTRESAHFRDHAIPIVVNNVSAGSKVQPGGYANPKPELEQFTIRDQRTPDEVAQALIRAGLQPIWKDWDFYLGRNLETGCSS